MATVIEGVYDLITNDAGVTDQLATYNGVPAVFTFAPFPEDAEYPAVTIQQAGGSLGTARDRSTKGGDVSMLVNVWHDKGASEKALRDLADDLWALLDRASLTVSGYDVVRVTATPPQRLEDPDGFPGYLITCSVLVRR